MNFRLYKPSGRLSEIVQGIWTVSVYRSNPVVKKLYSDAGSGIIFNLAGNLKIDGKRLSKGVIILPMNKHAAVVEMCSETQAAGIRFHPAIGYAVFGKLHQTPTLLRLEDDGLFHFYDAFSRLQLDNYDDNNIEILSRWLNENFTLNNVLPNSLENVLSAFDNERSVGELIETLTLSQRQIERLFKLWLGITPKYYQRILRIKSVVDYLRTHKNSSLADVAQQFGFSDQAHMTREFRLIAKVTPGQL